MPRQFSWNTVDADGCTLRFGPLPSNNAGTVETNSLGDMKRERKPKTKNARHARPGNVSTAIKESNRLERLRNSIFCVRSNDELSKRSDDVDSSPMDVLYHDGGNVASEKSARNQHVNRIERCPATSSSRPENLTNQQNRKNVIKTLESVNRTPANLSE